MAIRLGMRFDGFDPVGETIEVELRRRRPGQILFGWRNTLVTGRELSLVWLLLLKLNVPW